MANKYRKLSTQGYMDIGAEEWAGMTDADKRAALTETATTAKKRIKRQESRGLISPETSKRLQDKFSLKGKTGAELEQLSYDLREFINNPITRLPPKGKDTPKIEYWDDEVDNETGTETSIEFGWGSAYDLLYYMEENKIYYELVKDILKDYYIVRDVQVFIDDHPGTKQEQLNKFIKEFLNVQAAYDMETGFYTDLSEGPVWDSEDDLEF